MLGIAPKGEFVSCELGFLVAVVQGAKQMREVSGLMLTGLVKLIKRVIPWTDMGGRLF